VYFWCGGGGSGDDLLISEGEDFAMRARTIKIAFWRSESIACLSDAAKLLYVGLWGLADREGKLKDKPITIGFEVRPWDPMAVPALLEELFAAHLVIRYTAGGEGYLWVPSLPKHQKFHPKEKPVGFPGVDSPDAVVLAGRLKFLPEFTSGSSALDSPRQAVGEHPGAMNEALGSPQQVVGDNLGSPQQVVGEHLGSPQQVVGEHLKSMEGTSGSPQQVVGEHLKSMEGTSGSPQQVASKPFPSFPSFPSLSSKEKDPPAGGKRASKKRSPPTPRESDEICQDFLEVTGKDYAWDGGRDGKAFAALRLRASMEEIRERWQRGLSNVKTGIFPQISTISELQRWWNNLAVAPVAPIAPGPRRSVPDIRRSPIPATEGTGPITVKVSVL